MANTTADKLAKLNATKADLKAALAEKGQTVGEVFSEYPAAVRAIETGAAVAVRAIETGAAVEEVNIKVFMDMFGSFSGKIVFINPKTLHAESVDNPSIAGPVSFKTIKGGSVSFTNSVYTNSLETGNAVKPSNDSPIYIVNSDCVFRAT